MLKFFEKVVGEKKKYRQMVVRVEACLLYTSRRLLPEGRPALRASCP